MKYHFIANWKMNMLQQDTASFCSSFLPQVADVDYSKAVVGIAPSATCISTLVEASAQSQVEVGGQNVHWLDSGAHTGELSADMLLDLGAKFAVIGHSERRQFYGETDEAVSLRAKAAIEKGLRAIVCVGESETQFKAKQTRDVVHSQLTASLAGLGAQHLSGLVVAYEPVWAIGTGLAATPEIAAEVHNQIRGELEELFGAAAGSEIALLYGGSTKPENIAELCAQEHVNGALVGGASLKPDSFAALVKNGLS